MAHFTWAIQGRKLGRLASLAHENCSIFRWFLYRSAVVGCDRDFPEKVVQTIKQPDGDAVAIVTNTEGPATVPDGVRVYLALAKSLDDRSEMLRYDKGTQPEVKWIDASHLFVKVQCGQIYRYSNFTYLRPASRDFEKITVLLENHGVCPD